MEQTGLCERVGPIRASEALANKQDTIPQEVFEVFNEQITENLSRRGSRAVVYQDVVVELLEERGIERSDIYKKGWLDVEPLYEEAGWKVQYDKPAYCENYRAHFIFDKPSNS